MVIYLCVFSSCRKCIRCSYDNNLGTRTELPEYCGKKKMLEEFKAAYDKTYKNFSCTTK